MCAVASCWLHVACYVKEEKSISHSVHDWLCILLICINHLLICTSFSPPSLSLFLFLPLSHCACAQLFDEMDIEFNPEEAPSKPPRTGKVPSPGLFDTEDELECEDKNEGGAQAEGGREEDEEFEVIDATEAPSVEEAEKQLDIVKNELERRREEEQKRAAELEGEEKEQGNVKGSQNEAEEIDGAAGECGRWLEGWGGDRYGNVAVWACVDNCGTSVHVYCVQEANCLDLWLTPPSPATHVSEEVKSRLP